MKGFVSRSPDSHACSDQTAPPPTAPAPHKVEPFIDLGILSRTSHHMAMVFMAALLALVAASDARGQAKTYMIEEHTNYVGNGCPNTNLNTVTSALRDRLNQAGWTGLRYTNALAWPQDWKDTCKSGYDSSYTDNNTLAVFAGHGSSGTLQHAYIRGGVCNATFQNDMRLGMMGGKKAAYGMWLSCNALQIVQNASSQWLRQHFGWLNSIAIGDLEPYYWFDKLDPAGWLQYTNKGSWLNTMKGGGRQPVVVTFSDVSANQCWAVHNDANLFYESYRTPRPNQPAGCAEQYPLNYWCAEWISVSEARTPFLRGRAPDAIVAA